jgi:hypothetical protein
LSSGYPNLGIGDKPEVGVSRTLCAYLLVRQDSCVDRGEVAGAVGHGLGGDATVEGGEAGIMMASQGEEVEVGDPRGREERGSSQMGRIEKGDVIGAKLVARVGAKRRQHVIHLSGSAERIRVSALACDADDTVLHQRAGEKAQVRRGFDPVVRRLVKDVLRIELGEHRVEVEEVTAQSMPSDRVLTPGKVPGEH